MKKSQTVLAVKTPAEILTQKQENLSWFWNREIEKTIKHKRNSAKKFMADAVQDPAYAFSWRAESWLVSNHKYRLMKRFIKASKVSTSEVFIKDCLDHLQEDIVKAALKVDGSTDPFTNLSDRCENAAKAELVEAIKMLQRYMNDVKEAEKAL